MPAWWGIVAAVLGIINTMSNLEDPESVVEVAAALSGTFLGISLWDWSSA